jgi:hypothetical protein
MPTKQYYLAVITMQPISKLFKQIRDDFAAYNFVQEADFRWSPPEKTVFHPLIGSSEDIWSLLHEVAHGELAHQAYGLDIELIGHEAQAWHYAVNTLAPLYNIEIDDDYVQDHLDTYREWLHARSMCPDCEQNGLQTNSTYRCLNCKCYWQANEAKLCALRRIRLQGQSQNV